MKAIVINKYGDPSVLTEETIPKPTLTQEHDLLINIKAIATNPVDFKKRTNFGKITVPIAAPPLVLGWDAAGVVEQVGSAVTKFKVGDEVYYAGQVNRPGCYAQYQLVNEFLAGRKPKNISFDQAASFPLTSITAWEGLIENMAIPETGNEKKQFLLSLVQVALAQ